MAAVTFDSAITTTIAAMFGTSAGTATPSTSAGTSTLSAFLVDVPPGCVADVADVGVSTTVSLSGATPSDGTPTITSGDDLAALSPGFGMVGRWYTSAGGTVPASVPTPVSATWTGAVAPGSSLVVFVWVDLDDSAAGTLTTTAPTVDVTFAPGSACAGGASETYRPPVGRYPARADRPSSVVGDRSAFRRR